MPVVEAIWFFLEIYVEYPVTFSLSACSKADKASSTVLLNNVNCAFSLLDETPIELDSATNSL